MEEAQKQKKEVARREGGRDQGRSRENHDLMGRSSRYAPHRGIRDRTVHVCEEGVEVQAPVSREKSGKYYALHQECTHDTRECRTLQQRHQFLIQEMVSVPPRDVIPSRENGKQEIDSTKEDRKLRDGPTKGVINMISGGSTDRDSNWARKSWSRKEILALEERRQDSGPIITFGPRDLEGVNLPHNDVLLIQARIANYDMRRVFVDSGSLGYELSPIKTSLYGFAGHTVHPQGEILLPITLGTGDGNKTVLTRFTLVEAPSSYNVILGRPTMNSFRAVASAYHQKIKFPVGDKVGEVRGDQPSSRKCYAETVKVDYKRARQIGK
ncbi:uncharacterized protein [Henckelia pumila]|uniref:uncharacterized protein n=1 Tax=Henckelia pumila TaxID=405737 RepID=UPI003C6E9559